MQFIACIFIFYSFHHSIARIQKKRFRKTTKQIFVTQMWFHPTKTSTSISCTFYLDLIESNNAILIEGFFLAQIPFHVRISQTLISSQYAVLFRFSSCINLLFDIISLNIAAIFLVLIATGSFSVNAKILATNWFKLLVACRNKMCLQFDKTFLEFVVGLTA